MHFLCRLRSNLRVGIGFAAVIVVLLAAWLILMAIGICRLKWSQIDSKLMEGLNRPEKKAKATDRFPCENFKPITVSSTKRRDVGTQTDFVVKLKKFDSFMSISSGDRVSLEKSTLCEPYQTSTLQPSRSSEFPRAFDLADQLTSIPNAERLIATADSFEKSQVEPVATEKKLELSQVENVRLYQCSCGRKIKLKLW